MTINVIDTARVTLDYCISTRISEVTLALYVLSGKNSAKLSYKLSRVPYGDHGTARH